MLLYYSVVSVEEQCSHLTVRQQIMDSLEISIFLQGLEYISENKPNSFKVIYINLLVGQNLLTIFAITLNKKERFTVVWEYSFLKLNIHLLFKL